MGLYFYLFERQKGRERMAEIFHPDFLPKCLQEPGLGQAKDKSLESSLGPWACVLEPSPSVPYGVH